MSSVRDVKYKAGFKLGNPTKRSEYSIAFLMLMPTLILFLLFVAYPVFYVLRTGFFEYDGLSPMKWVGLYNYARVIKDGSWWVSVWNTLQLGIGIPMVQIPLALITAVILNGKIKGRNFFRVFFFLPNITSTAIMGIIFYFMFAAQNGIVNGILIKLHLINLPVEWLGKEYLAKLVIILFSTWAATGFYMVLFLASLQKIPREVYESATIDGANDRQTLFRITIPMLGQMFQIITMLSILNAMKLFDTVKVITGGGPGNKTEVMTMYMFRYYFEAASGIMQQGYAAAVAVVGLLITGMVAAVYYIFSKRINSDYD